MIAEREVEAVTENAKVVVAVVEVGCNGVRVRSALEEI
jgi:hypothetical protein